MHCARLLISCVRITCHFLGRVLHTFPCHCYCHENAATSSGPRTLPELKSPTLKRVKLLPVVKVSQLSSITFEAQWRPTARGDVFKTELFSWVLTWLLVTLESLLRTPANFTRRESPSGQQRGKVLGKRLCEGRGRKRNEKQLQKAGDGVELGLRVS